MPIQAVQKLIYRNMVQRPTVNRVFDDFGCRLNGLLDKLGIQKRYATGLTRNKAIAYASKNLPEIESAARKLTSYERARAVPALAEAHRQTAAMTLSIDFSNYTPSPFANKEDKNKALANLRDYLKQLNIDFSHDSNIRISPMNLSLIKMVFSLINPQIDISRLLTLIHLGKGSPSHHEYKFHFSCVDPAYVADRKMVIHVLSERTTWMLYHFSMGTDPLYFLTLLLHEFGHLAYDILSKGFEEGRPSPLLEPDRIGNDHFSTDDDNEIFSLVWQTIPSSHDLHRDFFCDFMILYVLAGEKLRELIATRTNGQFRGLRTLYDLYKNTIFGGKEFDNAKIIETPSPLELLKKFQSALRQQS